MDTLSPYLPLLLHGTLVTIEVSVLSYVLALLIGIAGARARLRARSRLARWLLVVYTTLVRGIPDIAAILLIYVGSQQLANALTKLTGTGHVVVPPFLAGVVSVGVIYGAYLIETFRGAFLSIPKGQGEAAQALGLSRRTGFFLVILPQAIRQALPACLNYWQALLTSCAMVSVIGLDDVVRNGVDAGTATGQPIPFLGAALVFFLTITWLSGLLFGWLRRRFAIGGGRAV